VTDATSGAGLRPFGLGLDPLEGESLAGFVLRLAHRLHVSPHELARQTGLTEQDRLGRARASLSTLLSPAEVSRFALTTRLHPREVRAMTLEPFASRYPPAARSIDDVRAGRVYSMHTDGWLFPTTARYCPRCLAGDGSDIQNAHGGPWQIHWRLPVFFACPRLPQDLAERHLGFLPDTTPKLRRRAASVFLVRRARGGGLDKAAQFLGINPENKRLGYTQLLNRRLRTSGMARDFEQALDAITAELLEGPTIDYQHRREALATWALEPENWRRMLTRLPDLTSHRKPLSDDRRRLAVSAYIWTRVTEGEPDFAPCPPHIAPDPALRAVWTRERHNVFHWLRTTDHQPYYGALKPLLEQHAEQLAKAIDDHPQRRR
jgi:hypothetical protein